MPNKVTILNIPFHNTTENDLVTDLHKHLENRDKVQVVTANPEILMYANQDENYKKILERAEYVVADGIGVVIASKILKPELKERVAGFDLLKRILQLANDNSYKLYFLGAAEETLEKTVDNVKADYPNLKLVGYHHGFFKADDETVLAKVKAAQPDIVAVALGFPRQEEWISDNFKHFDHGLFIGVGGSFDVLAGEVKRAPELWQRLNLEWFYRLLQEPRRIKRMIKLPLFLLKVLGVKLLGKR